MGLRVATARRKFGGYKPEKPKAIRTLDVKPDRITELGGTWVRFLDTELPRQLEHDLYRRALRDIRGLNYSSRDVEGLSISLLAEFEDTLRTSPQSSRLPLFLTALINQGKEDNYEIVTNHIDEKLDYFCYRNIKYVTVTGDLGLFAGAYIKRGSLLVKGNVGEGAGWDMRGGIIIVEGHADIRLGSGMRGGRIIVKGNAEEAAGEGMISGYMRVEGNVPDHAGSFFEMIGEDSAPKKGGKLVVCGNAGDFLGAGQEGGLIVAYGNVGKKIGDRMKGGAIALHGEFESLGDIIHGKIYHKGRLIAEK